MPVFYKRIYNFETETSLSLEENISLEYSGLNDEGMV